MVSFSYSLKQSISSGALLETQGAVDFTVLLLCSVGWCVENFV